MGVNVGIPIACDGTETGIVLCEAVDLGIEIVRTNQIFHLSAVGIARPDIR